MDNSVGTVVGEGDIRGLNGNGKKYDKINVLYINFKKRKKSRREGRGVAGAGLRKVKRLTKECRCIAHRQRHCPW